MKTDANNNESGSAESQANSANAPPNFPPAEPATGLTEAEFLQQEAAKARAAIADAFADLRNNLKSTVDPHVLTRDHPWIAISTAAVAGFAAAVTLIPSKEQQALNKLAQLERARHAPPPPAAAASDNPAGAGGILGTIAAEALKTLRPLVTALLSAGIARAASAPPADSNGHTQTQDVATPS